MNRKEELKILIKTIRKSFPDIARDISNVSNIGDKSWISDMQEKTKLLNDYIDEYNSLK